MAMSRPLMNTEDSDGIFECPICLSSMTDRRPRALHCLHTFCEPCLVECTKNNEPGKLSCPSCRKVTPLPPGGVTELPHNFQLDKFSALLRHENVCQNCFETTQSPPMAHFFCNDCHKKYCDSCKGKHDTIPVFTDHQLFSILPKMPTEDQYKCALHGMALEIYCLKCEECLCSSCAMKQNHNVHLDKLVYMNKEMDTCSEEAAGATRTLKQRIPIWSDFLNETMQILNRLRTNIHDERNKRIEHINTEAERLEDELETEHIQPVEECLTRLRALKKSTEATENLIQRKQLTPGTIADLKRHTSESNENKRCLEYKMGKLQEVPDFVATPELTNLGSLSTYTDSKELSLPLTGRDNCSEKIISAGEQKDKRTSIRERSALRKPGTRVKVGPDWDDRLYRDDGSAFTKKKHSPDD